MWLYPASWRRRYGAEFEALLDDVRPGARELWDVVAGALKMQMIAWDWRKTAAAFALAGAAVAGVVALRTPNMYISTAVVKMPGSPDARRRWAIAEGDVLSRTSLAEIIMQHGLYPDTRKTVPLEDIVMAMRNRNIRIVPAGEDAFSVSFQYQNRETAQAVTRELAERFVDASAHARVPVQLEVLNGASLPQSPGAPNRPAIIVAGLAAGLGIGLVFLGVRRWPLVAACGAAAALVALAIAFLIPDLYISTAVMQLDAGADPSRLIQDTLSDANLAAIIRNPSIGLYRDEQKTPMAELVRKTRDRYLRVKMLKNPPRAYGNAFAVSFMADNRYTAQAVVRELVGRLTEQNVTEVRLKHHQPFNLMVLDPASLPERPAEPNRYVILMFGLMAGLIVGIVVLRRRRLKSLPVAA
jgi:capsular polysaccharide biosynthesis protein